MAFQDQNLTCRDCGNQFVWTASEQEFYQSKGFQNAPVRCPADRAAKKARMDGGGRGPRQMYEITCSSCGKKDSVPFQPRRPTGSLRRLFQKAKRRRTPSSRGKRKGF